MSGAGSTAYYERFYADGRGDVNDKVRCRIDQVRKMIPKVEGRVLDVGAGAGQLARLLSVGLEVTSCDFSEEAVARAPEPRAVARAGSLPFDDGSFEIVTCCEVLEHLDQHEFDQSRRELARVASQYVIVTVPNQQDLAMSQLTCPVCRSRFNGAGHVRAFSPEDMHGLLDGFSVDAIEEFGPDEHWLTPRWYTLKSALRGPHQMRRGVCPVCAFDAGHKGGPVTNRASHDGGASKVRALASRLQERFFGVARPAWIAARFRRVS